MSYRIETVLIPDCFVVKVTAKAALVRNENWDDEKWIPLSNLGYPDYDMEPGDSGDRNLRVVTWFAKQEGLI